MMAATKPNTAGSIDSCPTDATDEQLVTTINSLVDEVNDLREENDNLREENDNLREEINHLERRLDEQADRQARETATNRKRISALEESEAEDSDDSSHPSDGESATPELETSLEQVCALDEKTASQQLTSNQQRARFVAKNPADYFSKVPAGYVIDSGDIGKVLRAGTDCDGHTATVARVMGFLNKFGESDVKVVKRRGVKRVVFTTKLVERLMQLSSHGGDGRNAVTV
jgi:FtsZ-binding cell division protein ZapB